ncbi:hypothetical protein DM01DRAFT_1383795 [Hesseltinella vesiculosa]|uniref:Uncharacterized protein n=1 Tax=Hesseltinella vesiculosa TaxID=101127 RepID=A0A1X2GGG0_9FUNG|nr:hypothetical protein DM01DRAFT_1383795 [Hesseltinella vesiculosa]
MDDGATENAFWRPCPNGVCYCDYRLTIRGCTTTDELRILTIVAAAWSGACIAAVLTWLYHRVAIRGQLVFEMHGWFPRPKPIESLMFFALFFNIARLIHSCILLTDQAPWPVFRLIVYDLGWQCGFAAFSCYFFGVAHTLAASSKTIYNAWIRNPERVDVLCVVFITIPFILPTIFNILTGVNASQGNNDSAIFFTKVNYYIWMCLAIFLGIFVFFAGVRLVKLLTSHMVTKANQRVNIMKIKAGATKVKLTVFFGCVCIWGLAFFSGLFATARYGIITNNVYVGLVSGVINFIGIAATTLILTVLVVEPGFVNSLSSWSLGSSSEARSHPSQYMMSNMGTTTLENSYHTMSMKKHTKAEATTDTFDEDTTLATGITTSDTDSRHNLMQPSNPSLRNYADQNNYEGSRQQQAQSPVSPRSPIAQQFSSHGMASFDESYQSATSKSSFERPKIATSPRMNHSPRLGGIDRSPRLMPVRPGSPSLGQVEEDRLHYNHAIGQLRLPANYVSPEDRRRQELDPLGQNHSRY